jgi:hypothetical protein
MRGSCYFTYFALLAILFFPACQKKSPVLSPVPSAFQPPDEPIQNLAWQSASRIKKGFPDDSGSTFRLEEFTNPSALPASVLEYFRKALEKQLESHGLQVRKDSENRISGSLLRKEKQLIFSFAVSSPEALLLSDSASIPDDSRFRNTLAQFETPSPAMHVHRGRDSIPASELEQPPLDILAVCPSSRTLHSCAAVPRLH